MPTATFPLLTLFLAFSAQLLLVAASPVTWYPALTATTSSASNASTSSSIVWYKADPTTSKKPSSPSAFSTVWYKAPPSSSSAVPAAPSPTYYSGNMSIVGKPSCTTNCFFGVYTLFPGSTPCADLALPGTAYQQFMTTQYRGLSLSPDFYNQHGGLDKFCGKGVQLTDPSNPHATTDTYYIVRGCAEGECVGDSLGGSSTANLYIRQNWTSTAHAAGDTSYKAAGSRQDGYAVKWRFV